MIKNYRVSSGRARLVVRLSVDDSKTKGDREKANVNKQSSTEKRSDRSEKSEQTYVWGGFLTRQGMSYGCERLDPNILY